MRAGGFEFSRKEQAMKVHGTEDDGRPRVARINAGFNDAVSGKLKSVARAAYGKVADYTLTPRRRGSSSPPYRSSRADARETIGPERFVETCIKAPLEVCEKRDPEGLYARARRGRSTTWPGYRPPSRGRRNPDLVAETTVASPEETVAWMLEALRKAGRLP
jgi:hypothetical protein